MAHLYLRNRAGLVDNPSQDDPRFEEDVIPAADALFRSAPLKEMLFRILVRVRGTYWIFLGATRGLIPLTRDAELGPKAQLIRGLDSTRSGDVLLLLKPGKYFKGLDPDLWGELANHGSIHDSDISVPIILAGGGIEHKISTVPVSTVNIAKTVAQYLGFVINRVQPPLPGVPLP